MRTLRLCIRPHIFFFMFFGPLAVLIAAALIVNFRTILFSGNLIISFAFALFSLYVIFVFLLVLEGNKIILTQDLLTVNSIKSIIMPPWIKTEIIYLNNFDSAILATGEYLYKFSKEKNDSFLKEEISKYNTAHVPASSMQFIYFIPKNVSSILLPKLMPVSMYSNKKLKKIMNELSRNKISTETKI